LSYEALYMPSKPPREGFASTTTHDDLDVPLIGESNAIRLLGEQIDRAARSDAKVLVTGETGSGKEVAVRLIHRRSARRDRSFVTLNCAGVPETLLESELFGHVRGAFTGAYRDKPGLLEVANGGTIFLDEIGEMSLRMQAVLLRFLQSGEIQRVGADRAHARVNVRMIAATNRDLRHEVAAGSFREDFYFRINVINISVPPLRDRLSDVPLLADFLLNQQAAASRPQLSPEALAVLMRYAWPGNVRELRNLLERLAVDREGQVVRPEDLPAHITSAAEAAAAAPPPVHATLNIVHDCAARMLVHGESFWAVVATPFEEQRLSIDDVRRIVKLGLQRAEGSQRTLAALFNVPKADVARFLNFLQAYGCHLPPEGLRPVAGRPARGRTAGEK
jgi:transcriptional regulator with GAF, ATPase, and Fis domain